MRAVIRALGGQPLWVATAIAALLTGPGQPALERLELASLDLLDAVAAQVARSTRPAPATRQLLVAIDEPALEAQGRWPWPRAVHARLVDALHEAGATVIGYDVLFSEPADPEGDAALARAIARHGQVVLPLALATSATGDAPAPLPPLPALARSAAALGHVDAPIDRDGIIRRLPLRAGIAGETWDAMPAVVLRLAQGRPATGPAPRPVLPNPAAWWRDELVIPREPLGEVAQISARDVLQGDPAALAAANGRIVWVGVTAPMLDALMTTQSARHGHLWSSVRWQAQALASLDGGKVLRPVPEAGIALANVLPLALLALMAQLSLWRQRRRLGPRAAARSSLQLELPRGGWQQHLLVMLPLPLAGSLALLLAGHLWLPTAALSCGLLSAWALMRATELQRARTALEQARGQADATLRAITDAVFTLDGQWRVLYLNPSAERLTDTTSAQALGRPAAELLRLDDRAGDHLEGTLATCLYERRAVAMPQPLAVEGMGGRHLVRLIASPLRQPPLPALRSLPGMPEVVLALSDVTSEVLAGERLRHEATHDHLTGLPNRTLLADRLQHALAGALQAQRMVAVLFVDLDRFKRINDGLGHRLGDAVLREVARRLQTLCRPHDTVARWGGDEFVVLLEDVGSREVVAAMAGRLIDHIATEFRVDGIDVECGCCIGVALAPQDGLDAESLLAQADTAMYRAKARGGRRFEFYASEMPAWTREGLALETRLRHGLESRDFVLHYQPQVRLSDGQTVGLEALLRWRQPDGQLWGPGRFLSVTEETGLIQSLGAWVIAEATRQLARWRDAGVPLVPVSVNVSARQCLDRELVRVVDQALNFAGLPPALLKLEVTESAAMADLGQLKGLLAELRALGVAVAMDDFGTGYSSLAHLQRFPVDQIKIDQSFVRDIDSADASGHSGAAIVRATIALAHGLGVPVVAEGVESAEQLRFLAEHRCDIAQGFLYARPLADEDAAAYLRRGVNDSRLGPLDTAPAALATGTAA